MPIEERRSCLKTYRFETNDGLIVEIELVEDSDEGDYKHKRWSITILSPPDFCVVDSSMIEWPPSVLNVDMTTSMLKEGKT